MSLTGPSDDTVEEFAETAADNAEYLFSQAEAFLRGVTETAVDFRTIGDYEELNYLQWDYEAELSDLRDNMPGLLSFDTAVNDADVDRIGSVVLPTPPDLTLPTATVPTLDAERPVVDLPALPDADVGTAPSDMPVLLDTAVPDAPTLTLPNVPTFESLNLPAAPTVVLPSFDSEAPSNQLTAPTSAFDYVDSGYVSQLRDPVVAKLLADLSNGGYGIEPDDEISLWTRARDRAAQLARTAQEEAMEAAARSGMQLPGAAVVIALDRARQVARAEMSKANMEIALKRADMYVENRKFTIEKALELEKLAQDLYNAIQERAYNVARGIVEIGIAVYDASVRNFNAQLEAHRVAAQVFESRIRGALATAELFKAQIEAEKLRGDFNMQRVQLYQAQLNGIQTIANLYKSRVEAASLLTQIQTQRVEAFRAKVQAFGEGVRAKAAEFDMYRASVEGQVARMEMYKTDIGAYEARMRAEELRTKVLLQGNDALLQRYQASLAGYKAQLDSFVSQASSRNERDRTYVMAQGVNAQVYRVLTDAVLAGVNSRISTQKMNNDWNMAALDSRVNVTKNRLEQLKLTIANLKDINQNGMKFYGDMTTTVLGSVSALTTKSSD